MSLPAELQREILRLQTASAIIDNEIDNQQDKVINLLKQVILEKHYYIHRLFTTEYHCENKAIREFNPLDEIFFKSEDKFAAENFAALDLPSDFSKGPMKAFLNTLLESLESFLPAFYRLNPHKIPGRFPFPPADILVRCVFPALFGYCWAIEPAEAYSENLVKWFEEIYKTREDFISNFREHWMFNAMRGFFTSIDLNSFYVHAIRDILYSYVQLIPEKQTKPEVLIQYAKDLLSAIFEKFDLLPKFFSKLFTSLYSIIEAGGHSRESIQKEINTITQVLFYDGVIEPALRHPLLYVSGYPFLESDIDSFRLIYVVFQTALGTEVSESDKELSNIIKEKLEGFNPMDVIDCIREERGCVNLPSLQDFCNIVQCAHQPLLMSTHHLSLLFRFVSSLQHLGDLPKSIDRSISKVFEQALTDKLEELPDNLFWFPCFSLTYMNVSSTNFEKTLTLSPAYRLLSSPLLRINSNCPSFNEAFNTALKTVNLSVHPEIRTEILWIINKGIDGMENKLSEEINKKQEEVNKHRIRANQLMGFASTLKMLMNAIPINNPKMALAFSIIQKNFDPKTIDVRQKDFAYCMQKEVEAICGSSFVVVGSYCIQWIVMVLCPNIKTTKTFVPEFSSNTDIATLQKLTRQPIITSSLLPDAIRLARDCVRVLTYAGLMSIQDPLARAFTEQFIQEPRSYARNMQNCIMFFGDEILGQFLTKEELGALYAFFASVS